MARLKVKHQWFLSSTSAGEKDLTNIDKPFQISDAYPEGGVRVQSVANGAANELVDLCGLADVRALFILVDGPVTFRINGTIELLPTTVPPGWDYGVIQLTTQGLTSLDVSNSSGTAVKITVASAGDPV